MTENPRLAARRAQLEVAGGLPMTAEEILAGQSQAGIPRPGFLKDHEDDGTVDNVVPQPGGDE